MPTTSPSAVVERAAGVAGLDVGVDLDHAGELLGVGAGLVGGGDALVERDDRAGRRRSGCRRCRRRCRPRSPRRRPARRAESTASRCAARTRRTAAARRRRRSASVPTTVAVYDRAGADDGHGDLGGAVDHVVVGEDLTVRGEHDAGAGGLALAVVDHGGDVDDADRLGRGGLAGGAGARTGAGPAVAVAGPAVPAPDPPLPSPNPPLPTARRSPNRSPQPNWPVGAEPDAAVPLPARCGRRGRWPMATPPPARPRAPACRPPRPSPRAGAAAGPAAGRTADRTAGPSATSAGRSAAPRVRWAGSAAPAGGWPSGCCRRRRQGAAGMAPDGVSSWCSSMSAYSSGVSLRLAPTELPHPSRRCATTRRWL